MRERHKSTNRSDASQPSFCSFLMVKRQWVSIWQIIEGQNLRETPSREAFSFWRAIKSNVPERLKGFVTARYGPLFRDSLAKGRRDNGPKQETEWERFRKGIAKTHNSKLGLMCLEIGSFSFIASCRISIKKNSFFFLAKGFHMCPAGFLMLLFYFKVHTIWLQHLRSLRTQKHKLGKLPPHSSLPTSEKGSEAVTEE